MSGQILSLLAGMVRVAIPISFAALAGMLGAELVQTIGHYGILFKKKKEKSKFDFIKG